MKNLIITLMVLFMLPLEAFSENATYYGNQFSGRKMANGKIYSHQKMVAAHNRYPLGTRLKVVNKKNGKSVLVTVSDRCKCSIDLSPAAFRRISNTSAGRVAVRVVVSG